MAGKGPPKTPSKILQMRGSWRGDVVTDEPEIEPAIPPIPAWLDESLHGAFNTTARQLFELGIIGDVDGPSLARLVWLRSRFEQSAKIMDEQANTYTDAIGNQKVCPDMKVIIDLATKIDQLEYKFGITPSARTGLATVMGKKDQKKKAGGIEQFRQKEA